jgi:ribosomal protein S1
VKLVVLSIDPIARRMSFSLKQAAPDPQPVADEPAAAPPAHKKKRPPLRGGLDL